MKQTALHCFVDGVGLVSSSNARTQDDASLAPNVTISSQPVALQSQTASHCIDIDSRSFIQNVMNKYLSESATTSYKFSLNDIAEIGSGFDFSKRYIVGPMIGGGGDGTVHSVLMKSAAMRTCMVIKKISVDSHSDFHLFQKLSASLQELHLIKRTKIATLHALYYDARNSAIYKLYDRFDADLSQIIYKLNTHKLGLTEPQTCRLIRSLCAKVDILHRNGYIHGDIKPSNILFGSHANEWHLIDFDRVKYCQSGAQILSKFCGTFGFTAPELIHHGGPLMNKLDHSIDIWAIGLMVIWCLNGGHLGFMEVEPAVRDAYNVAAKDGNMVVMTRIFHEYYNSVFNYETTSLHTTATPRYMQEIQRLYDSNKISLSLYDLLNKILVRHPHQRLNASQVLKHEWFTMTDGCDPIEEDDMITIADGTLRNFYQVLIDPNTEHIAIDMQKTRALYDLNTQCLQLEDAYEACAYNDELLDGSTSYAYDANAVQNNNAKSVAFDGFGGLFGNNYAPERKKEFEDAVFVSFSSVLGEEEVVECESTETMDILDLLNGSISYEECDHESYAIKEEEVMDGWREEYLLCGCDDNNAFDDAEEDKYNEKRYKYNDCV